MLRGDIVIINDSLCEAVAPWPMKESWGEMEELKMSSKGDESRRRRTSGEGKTNCTDRSNATLWTPATAKKTITEMRRWKQKNEEKKLNL